MAFPAIILVRGKCLLARAFPLREMSCEAIHRKLIWVLWNFFRGIILSRICQRFIEREFRKRDANTKNLLAAGSLSPALKDFVFGVKAPAPCRFFCGRDMELGALHEMLCSQGKVFLQGIAGIGKSELAKAYAKRYSREYTNIIYFTYSGDLKRDIANLDFADDVDDNETMDARFSRHHRLLRRLRDDSLLIIDNFNTVTLWL